MNISTWLTQWFARHPLKEPASHNPAWFTAQVMQRVKAAAQPVPAITPTHQWFSWPRLGFATALATAAIVLVAVPKSSTSGRLASAVLSDTQLLEALDEAAVDTVDTDMLAQELQLHDAMMLAEAQPSDDQWIEQTMQLLDQLDQESQDDSSASTPAPSDDDDLLNELQLFDEHAVGVQS